MADVKLQLELVDVYGKPLAEKVDIILRHQVLSETMKASKPANKQVLIGGLRGAPQGLYKLEIDPPSYQYVAQFVNMNPSGTTTASFQFPIDPGKVMRVNLQAYASLTAELQTLLENSDKVLAFEGKKGKPLYDALDDIRKAGMMNIVAKTENTPLTNGRTVFSYIQKLNEIRGDRFFCVVPRELREETK